MEHFIYFIGYFIFPGLFIYLFFKDYKKKELEKNSKQSIINIDKSLQKISENQEIIKILKRLEKVEEKLGINNKNT